MTTLCASIPVCPTANLASNAGNPTCWTWVSDNMDSAGNIVKECFSLRYEHACRSVQFNFAGLIAFASSLLRLSVTFSVCSVVSSSFCVSVFDFFLSISSSVRPFVRPSVCLSLSLPLSLPLWWLGQISIQSTGYAVSTHLLWCPAREPRISRQFNLPGCK